MHERGEREEEGDGRWAHNGRGRRRDGMGGIASHVDGRSCPRFGGISPGSQCFSLSHPSPATLPTLALYFFPPLFSPPLFSSSATPLRASLPMYHPSALYPATVITGADAL